MSAFVRWRAVLALALVVLVACGEAEPATWDEPVALFGDRSVSQVSFTSAGQLLFVSDGAVLRANVDGSGLETLVTVDGARRASMDAAGNIVLDDDRDIFLYRVDSDDVISLADNPKLFEFAASFTPTGEITFVTIDDENRVFGIWIMDADGGNRRQLASSTAGIFRHPRTSRDGTRRSYFVTGQGNPFIAVMNADGTDPKRLTEPDEIARQASWNPDGRVFVYSMKSETFDLWLMRTDGSEKTLLLALSGDEAKPVFSPDGNHIAFVCSGCRGEQSSLYVMSMRT